MPALPKLILIVTNNETFVKEVSGHLNKYGSSNISIKSCRSSEAEAHVSRLAPSVLLIDLINPPESVLTLIQKIRSSTQIPRIIGAGQPPHVSVLMKFIKMGVKDFLNIPFDDEEIKEIIHQLIAVPEEGAPKNHQKEKEAKVITFYSPKGGVGVTLLAANLSVVLASHYKKKTVICDLAPQCGDIATYLNLVPHYTVRDIIDNDQLMDASFLEGCLLGHASGVKILAAPTENQDPLTSDNLNVLKSILTLLKKSFDTILIDSSHLAPALLQYVMSDSDLIFLVGNPDVVSLKGLVGSFNKLQAMHYDTQKIKVLINRHNSKSQIDTDEFEKVTLHPIAGYLPNNFMLCIEAVNTGQPIFQIQEKSDLAKKISELAGLILRSSISENDESDPHSESSKSFRESLKKGIFRCF